MWQNESQWYSSSFLVGPSRGVQLDSLVVKLTEGLSQTGKVSGFVISWCTWCPTQTLEVCRNLGCGGSQDSEESLLKAIVWLWFQGAQDIYWCKIIILLLLHFWHRLYCETLWVLALHQALQTNISHITMPKPSNACVTTWQQFCWHAPRRTHWVGTISFISKVSWLQSSLLVALSVARTFGPRNQSCTWSCHNLKVEEKSLQFERLPPASQKTQAWVKSEPQDISQKASPYYGQ